MTRRGVRITSTALVALVVAAATLASGCATKKALRQGLAVHDAKIADLGTQIEGTQRDLEGVRGEATDARRIGSEAGTQAGVARTRADEAYGLAKGKLLYKVVLSEKAGNFAFNRYELSDETRRALDQLASQLKAENANVYLEIQGYTDATGPEQYNLVLGQRRAEAVRTYLSTQHQIPLHKMSVISFGETQPVAPNDTREGRSQNRRVEINVLS